MQIPDQPLFYVCVVIAIYYFYTGGRTLLGGLKILHRTGLKAKPKPPVPAPHIPETTSFDENPLPSVLSETDKSLHRIGFSPLFSVDEYIDALTTGSRWVYADKEKTTLAEVRLADFDPDTLRLIFFTIFNGGAAIMSILPQTVRGVSLRTLHINAGSNLGNVQRYHADCVREYRQSFGSPLRITTAAMFYEGIDMTLYRADVGPLEQVREVMWRYLASGALIISCAVAILLSWFVPDSSPAVEVGVIVIGLAMGYAGFRLKRDSVRYVPRWPSPIDPFNAASRNS